jgi:hypothetical protein
MIVNASVERLGHFFVGYTKIWNIYLEVVLLQIIENFDWWTYITFLRAIIALVEKNYGN